MSDPATKEFADAARRPAPPPVHGRFEPTHWSVVLQAGRTEEPGAAQALETLCRSYWYPVYAWIRSRGHGPEEAQDLAQDFFSSLLRRDSLAGLSEDKGRFRTFLIRSIQYFLADYHSWRTAARRGGTMLQLSLDGMTPEERYELEPAVDDAPDAAFDRRWTMVLVTRALERLDAEQAAAGRGEVMAALREFIGGVPDAGDYARAAQALGMSQNAIAVTVRQLRLRCRELIKEEIMETVESREAAESELRSLFRW